MSLPAQFPITSHAGGIPARRKRRVGNFGLVAERIAGTLCGLILLVCAMTPRVLRADDLPAAPEQYFNDYAHVVDQGTAETFNDQLADFERQTSNQILVAVYPKLQTDDALDDFCYRTFQKWGVGQKKLNNGAVLFVFVADHKMRIQTGYGLEGALPDITCERIMDDEMAPYFKQGDYTGGLRTGINAMMAATKGEYKGTGQTDADTGGLPGNKTRQNILVLLALGLLVLLSCFRTTRGILYGPNGVFRFAIWMLLSGSSGGGGSGGGGGGGGGFSGGGGSSGGGGASGSW